MKLGVRVLFWPRHGGPIRRSVLDIETRTSVLDPTLRIMRLPEEYPKASSSQATTHLPKCGMNVRLDIILHNILVSYSDTDIGKHCSQDVFPSTQNCAHLHPDTHGCVAFVQQDRLADACADSSLGTFFETLMANLEKALWKWLSLLVVVVVSNIL